MLSMGFPGYLRPSRLKPCRCSKSSLNLSALNETHSRKVVMFINSFQCSLSNASNRSRMRRNNCESLIPQRCAISRNLRARSSSTLAATVTSSFRSSTAPSPFSFKFQISDSLDRSNQCDPCRRQRYKKSERGMPRKSHHRAHNRARNQHRADNLFHRSPTVRLDSGLPSVICESQASDQNPLVWVGISFVTINAYSPLAAINTTGTATATYAAATTHDSISATKCISFTSLNFGSTSSPSDEVPPSRFQFSPSRVMRSLRASKSNQRWHPTNAGYTSAGRRSLGIPSTGCILHDARSAPAPPASAGSVAAQPVAHCFFCYHGLV